MQCECKNATNGQFKCFLKFYFIFLHKYRNKNEIENFEDYFTRMNFKFYDLNSIFSSEQNINDFLFYKNNNLHFSQKLIEYKIFNKFLNIFQKTHENLIIIADNPILMKHIKYYEDCL